MANSANFESSIIIRAGVEGISDLNQLIDVIEQAGGDVSHLRTQAEQLSNTWNALSTEEQNRQLQELGQSAQGLARQTNTATASMERMFNTRTDNSINAEIAQVNASLNTLNQRYDAGTISQNEFNRLIQAAQTRLNALQAELNQTATSVNRMENASSQAGGGIEKLTKNLMGMAGAYVGIEAVTSGIHELVETSKQMDSLNQKLEYATGGAKEAGETFDYLKNIAKQYGLEQMSLANGYAQLASATKGLNMSQEETRTAFEGVAKATAAMSLSADDANGVFLALSQIASKGKVSMEELKGQMGERLAPAMGIAAKAMGVTSAELEKMVENGINAKEFLPKFGAAMAESFNDQAAKNLSTTTGQLNLLTNKMTDLKAKVLDSFAGDGIASGMNIFTQGIDGIGNAIDNLDPATINAVKQTFASIFEVVGTLASQLKVVYDDFNNTFSSMTAIFGGADEQVGFITRTIQGLSIAIAMVSDGLNEVFLVVNFLKGGFEAFNASVMQGFAELLGSLSKIELLPDSMQSAFAGISENLNVASQKMQQASDQSFQAMEKNIANQGQATEKALNATIVTADQMAQQAEKASQNAIASFEKLAKDGSASGENLKTSFTEAVSKATDPEKVEGLIKKLTELKDKGVITGEELAQGMSIATPKLEELRQQFGQSVDSLEKLGLAGAQTAKNIKDKMADTATTLGLDFEKASNKTSDAFTKTAGAVLDVGQNFDQLKKEGYDATNLIEQGLTKMQATAKNKADFDLLNAVIKKMGQEGKLSGDQVTQALDGSKKKAKELEIGISDVEKAYAKLGIKSQAELQKQATESKQAYDQIAKDATATESIKQQAFEKSLQAAVDANDKTIISNLKAQASARGYAEVVIENGKVSTTTAKEIEEANAKTAESGKKVDQTNREIGESAAEAGNQSEAAMEKTASAGGGIAGALAAAYDKLTGTISSGLQQVGVSSEQVHEIFMKRIKEVNSMGAVGSGSDFGILFENLALLQKQTEENINAFNKTRESAIGMTQSLGGANASVNDLADANQALYHAQQANIEGVARMDSATLDNLKNAIDSARAKMEDLANQAKSTADNLEASLARMKGDDSTAMRLEQTKKLADLQDKLNEAQKRGNSEEVAQLQRAIELQKQINAEETRQTEIKKQQADEQKRQNAEKQAKQQQAKATPAPALTPSPTSTPQPSQAGSGNNGSNVSPKPIVDAIEDRIKRAKEEAKQELIQELVRDLKAKPN